MESQKDSQATSTSKGQDVPQRFSLFLSLKLTKLTSATYMVTDFLSDNEPIKWKLREKSLAIITDQSLSFRNATGFYRLADYGQLGRAISEIVALLDIVLVGSSVSVMNFSILKNEYQTLDNLLNERALDLSVSDYVNSHEVVEAERNIADLNSISTSRPTFTGQTSSVQKATNNFSGNSILHQPGVATNYLKDSIYSKGQIPRIKDNAFSIKDTSNKETKINAKKGTRRESIIDFLKDKEWVGIMDISKRIIGCSVKTVQRELADLVKDGTLKKQGEKRWSRYIYIS